MVAVTHFPCGPLTSFVRDYGFREGNTNVERARLVFPARNEQFLEFYLEDRTQVITYPSTERVVSPTTVLVGIQSIGRIDLFLGLKLRTFRILFRPTGFHQLFGFSMSEMAGKGLDAESFFGARVISLRDRLGECKDSVEMSIASDEFLLPFALKAIERRTTDASSIESALRAALNRPNQERLGTLVDQSCMSQRNLERKFKNTVGVSPKHYLRVARLQEAMKMKSKKPDLSWGWVAAATGYHDQMHLVHDFIKLGGRFSSQAIRIDG